MILDKQLVFSEEQAITASVVSTNVIDAGALGLNVGAGGSVIELLVKVTETFLAAGAATLAILFATDDDAAFPSGSVLAQAAEIAKADLTVGSEHFKIRVPHGCKRFLRLTYIVTTGPFTAGKLDAGLILDRHTNA